MSIQAKAAQACFDQVLSQTPDSAWADDCFLAKIQLAIDEHDLSASATLCVRNAKSISREPPASRRPVAARRPARNKASMPKPLTPCTAIQLSEGGSDQRRRAMNHQAVAQLAVCLAKLGQLAEAKATFQTMRAADFDKILDDEATCQVAEAAHAAGDTTWGAGVVPARLENGRSWRPGTPRLGPGVVSRQNRQPDRCRDGLSTPS